MTFNLERVDLTDEEYYGDYKRWMTSTKLRKFKECPYIFNLEQQGVIGRPAMSADLVIGSAVHACVLEGAKVFWDRFIIDDGPINPKSKKPYGRSTKTYAEWASKLHSENVLSNDEGNLVFSIADSVRNHVEAKRLFSTGEPEVAFRGTMWGVKVQAKIDWLDQDQGIVVDLKTCRTLRNFEHDFFSSYNLQAAFYAKICSEYLERPVKFYFVAVEKTFPYLCAVYAIDVSTMDNALSSLAKAFEFYKQCRDEEKWPTMTEALRHL